MSTIVSELLVSNDTKHPCGLLGMRSHALPFQMRVKNWKSCVQAVHVRNNEAVENHTALREVL